MILHGNQRGGGQDLAKHLLKEENDHVEVHELRGFVANDLGSALGETHAIARGTRAKQYLFSLSLNPPPEADVSTADFKKAISKVEDRLGLSGQPRAIVFHEKENRRHCHVVWSRIDPKQMKAIPLPYTKRSLQEVSRELYIEHGWSMPSGFVRSEERDPRNFTMAQWQQARRTGKDPRGIKTALQDCWAVSDSKQAFQSALKSRGFTLARGDRRGFVAIDQLCEIYSIPKWMGVKTQTVKNRLGDPASLPSVEEARTEIADMMQQKIRTLRDQQETAIHSRLDDLAMKRKSLMSAQHKEREAMVQAQQKRAYSELLTRRERYRKGLWGLVDRVTGRHKRVTKLNEKEMQACTLRDQKQRDELVFKQMEQSRAIQKRMERLRSFDHARGQSLDRDYQQYADIKAKVREQFEVMRAERKPHGPQGPKHEH